MATAKNVTEGASGHTPEPGQQAQQTQQSGAQNETLQGSPQQQRAQGQRQQGDQVPVQGQGGAMQSRRQGGLTRYSRDPLSNLQQIADEMDQLFETFFYGTPARSQRQGQQSRTPALWVPDVELQEEGNQLRIDIDLPGVPKENVRVQLQEGMLVIEGERRDERTEGGEREGFRRTERIYGSFYRAIPLPDSADVEHAQAQMKDGVLEIIVPLQQEKQPRRLEIAD
ncbi:MAG: hypothetical protein JWN13_4355 [Betaproteobacteria bacterium]|jgi:HSP20 family protein|nr:hypothetical protein [Betaproteobacteria bacterium]